MRARMTRISLAFCAMLMVLVAAPVVARAAPHAPAPGAAAAREDAPTARAHETRRHLRRAAWRRHHHHHHRLHARHPALARKPRTDLGAAGRSALASAVRETPAGLCYSPGDPAWCGELAAAQVGLALAINHALAVGVPRAALAEGAPAWQAERLQAAARSRGALIEAYLHRTSFVQDAAAAALGRSGREAS